MRTRHIRFAVAPIAAATLALALLAAGCGDASSQREAVASIDDASSPTAAGGSEDQPDAGGDSDGERDPREALLEYARCMREHGIDFPDPNFSAGRGTVRIDPSGRVDPDDPDFKAAQEECGGILVQAKPQLSEEERLELQEALLEYARCMREHGIDLPDPDFSGEDGVFRLGGPGKHIDRADPDFREADAACRPALEDALPRAGRDGAGDAE